MNYSKAAFELAAGTPQGLPASGVPEICFMGRSNVGKSSLINKVLGRKNLAYTGGKPGKTVTVNFYSVDTLRFVDMPGYGYAKVSDAEKLRWASLCEGYFNGKRNIKAAFQLVDIRRTPTDDDLQMIDFLKHYGYKFCIVLTKSDKLSKTARGEMTEKYARLFPECKIIPFSALSGEGTEDIKKIIEGLED